MKKTDGRPLAALLAQKEVGGQGPPVRKIVLAVLAALLVAAFAADRALPPPDPASKPQSTEVLDRDGYLLRAFAAPGGTWRLPARLDEIDPLLRRMVVAYEDKRFESHFGVDPLAMARAAGQLATEGRIVSGGSTLTMQLARIMEPRAGRFYSAKLAQALRALQYERRYSKREILSFYLTLAPYGGNLEGVRAASLAYFGKEPRKLSAGEAAFLVALPQSPEVRKPGGDAAISKAARDRVLDRMAEAGVIAADEAAFAKAEPAPTLRRALPVLAAHAADAARREFPAQRIVTLAIHRETQAKAETIIRERSIALGHKLSMAAIVVDHRTGEVLARAGSPGLFDEDRNGWVDMSRAVRSPGSTLKPFIYGLAFDSGVAHPDMLIEDRPEDFGGYRPTNFTKRFQGTLSLRRALQMSLNLPAVKLLDAVGPMRLKAAFITAGVELRLPRQSSPSLAVALGGGGLTLDGLAQLYTALPRGGAPVELTAFPLDAAAQRDRQARPALFGAVASWYLTDILKGTPAPDAARASRLAYKTGTSYGNRDAWAVGYDGRFVIAVWAGRADATAVPDLTGRSGAAPALFQLFEALGGATALKQPAPAGVIADAGGLPLTLRCFEDAQTKSTRAQKKSQPPAFVFPPEGARLAAAFDAAGARRPLIVKIQGGVAPFTFLVNGRPLGARARAREARLAADGAGFSSFTVIDARGQSDTVTAFIE